MADAAKGAAKGAPDGTALDTLALDDVVRLAAELIRIDTSNRGDGDGRERPAAEYVAAELSDAGLDPVLLEDVPGRSNVVARIAGRRPDLPAILLHGHLDVVPADASEWRLPPFAGEITADDGTGETTLWGRGAVDMKGTDAMYLALARAWHRTGRRPERDVVLAFTADEEDAADCGADFLAKRHADLFEGCTEGISESGAYTFHARPDVRLYPIATGERGTAWLELTAHGRAGHGSKRNPDNAVTRLAAAVLRIGEHEWPLRLTDTTRAAIHGIGAALGVDTSGLDDTNVYDLLAAFGPAGDLIAPTLRNSSNPTMLHAGYKVNVIPGTATARVDGRVVPGDGAVADFEAVLDELTGPDVSWRYVHQGIPLQAPHDAPLVAAMTGALRAELAALRARGVIAAGTDHVVTHSMSGGTDAKQFSQLGIVGYGFSPLFLPAGFDYHAMFHGVDERVPVEALHFGVRVLDRLLTAPTLDA
jgi:acetylornithine deacetylase/succinyl-diaminopimelate desuccinylase-like protein